MEYTDQEYLNLFKQVREKDQEIITKDYSPSPGGLFDQLRNNSGFLSSQMIKETPNYANYEAYKSFNQPNINEVQRNNYSQDLNLLNEFNIETRIYGENLNEVRRQSKEDRLNEVMQNIRQERLNEVKKTTDNQNLNEAVNFSDVDYVTLEMFDKARYNSMMKVARILPK